MEDRMRRRRLLAGSLAAGLAAPWLSRARAASPGGSVLRFVPQSDLAVLDPVWSTAYVTRNHAMMVFDTLYGQDSAFRARPQMVAEHEVSPDGLAWRLTLRDGLRFHDGEPVLARDCVASIRRWGARDGFGQTLMAATEELAAEGDRVIRFRLKRPFPLLPDALGKAGSAICAIMPERLARTDPFTQVTEMVGSGPFRFVASERVAGSRVVYARHEQYVPRPEDEVGGPADFTAGPKRVHFDRVEWHVLPDAATAANAMRAGEMDWWENPTADLLPMLRQDPKLNVAQRDVAGYVGCLRFNHLNPPFDNPAIRRALLGAVSQADYMTAVAGTDPANWNEGVGYFPPVSPLAGDAGMAALTGPRDIAGARRALAEAGYNGQKVVLLSPSDFPTLKALADVTADLLRRLGMNLDEQAMDWGSMVQRLPKRDPVEAGGWSIFGTFWSGIDQINPAVHSYLRGNGTATGWPRSEALESLRDEWLAAPDAAAQKSIAVRIQEQAFRDVPYIPLGQMIASTVFRREIVDVPKGFVLFWSTRRA
ncbi:ABC transporter substrate-binding protein [Roseomonas mucosa]|uniref:ABC transporter substrate-binding protein n=2 Tax=Roseomonas mucosa TaxID=207340 RepID=A0A1S8D4L1_9PROT|nr:ABC transporter substrate-binding protein [Roseomonas mucosa]